MINYHSKPRAVKNIFRSLLSCFVLLFLCNTISKSQSIAGIVFDRSSSEPVPFASVFLNGTSNGTITDGSGKFLISNVQPGSYELVVSFIGYDSYKQTIIIGTKPIQLERIFLSESSRQLATVQVVSSRDKKWEKQLKKFRKVFLGVDKFASTCELVNPWVINFPEDTVGNKFIAEAQEPIQIINSELGYKIIYHLDRFWAQSKDYEISGSVRFEELIASDENQLNQWRDNRAYCYKRSYSFLFKSMLNKTLSGSGFKVYSQEKNTNSQANHLGLENWVAFDTTGINSRKNPNQFIIPMKGLIQVLQTTKVKGAQSYILTKNDTVKTNRNGFALNPKDIIVYGDYSNNRVSSILPSDYEPDQTILMQQVDSLAAMQFVEKVYIHTDKPYYYPGETIWFKGYLNYGTPSWRDSLSRVVYVELISPNKKIINSKKILIDSGWFYNEFLLSDSLQAGGYFIRAYTNLSRNFGAQGIFSKGVQVLNMTDKVVEQKEKPTDISSLIEIVPSKKVYKTRETIVLLLKTHDEYGEPISANLSMSVTDVFQVAEIQEKETILTGYPFKKNEVVNPLNFKYPMESGISFSGSFLNDKNKPEALQLNFLDVKSKELYSSITNGKGLFSMTGLQFYDSTHLIVTTDKTKDEPYGHLTLFDRDIPSMLFEPIPTLEIVKTNSDQRIISEYNAPKDAIMLDEIVVKGRKIDDENRPAQNGFNGQIIKSKDLNKNSIYYNLMHMPGLIVDMSRMEVKTKKGFVGVSIDGLPIAPEFAGIRLFGLDSDNVEVIYVTKNYISVYTKAITDADRNNTNYQLIKIKGYSPGASFRYPDYRDPKTDTTLVDYRSTIYWNPSVVTSEIDGSVKLEFSAADLPGKYRIVVEGINQNGLPLRSIHFIDVEDR